MHLHQVVIPGAMLDNTLVSSLINPNLLSIPVSLVFDLEAQELDTALEIFRDVNKCLDGFIKQPSASVPCLLQTVLNDSSDGYHRARKVIYCVHSHRKSRGQL